MTEMTGMAMSTLFSWDKEFYAILPEVLSILHLSNITISLGKGKTGCNAILEEHTGSQRMEAQNPQKRNRVLQIRD
jgi:hypothetical protein